MCHIREKLAKPKVRRIPSGTNVPQPQPSGNLALDNEILFFKKLYESWSDWLHALTLEIIVANGLIIAMGYLCEFYFLGKKD